MCHNCPRAARQGARPAVASPPVHEILIWLKALHATPFEALIAGGVLTHVGDRLVERVRRKDGRSDRSYEHRRQAYEQFIFFSEKYLSVVKKHSDVLGLIRDSEKALEVAEALTDGDPMKSARLSEALELCERTRLVLGENDARALLRGSLEDTERAYITLNIVGGLSVRAAAEQFMRAVEDWGADDGVNTTSKALHRFKVSAVRDLRG